MCFWQKTISASTCSLNLVDSDTVDIGCACGLVHVLQTSHVATMSSTSWITDGGGLAALSSVFIWAAVACHHRRCSLRSSRRRAASSAVRKAFAVRWMSNRDQFVGG